MEAIILDQTMAMAAGIQDLILATTLVPILEMTMEDGILIRIPAMGVVTTLEMAGIQGQIMEDGTLAGEAECCVGKSKYLTYFLPVSVIIIIEEKKEYSFCKIE